MDRGETSIPSRRLFGGEGRPRTGTGRPGLLTAVALLAAGAGSALPAGLAAQEPDTTAVHDTARVARDTTAVRDTTRAERDTLDQAVPDSVRFRLQGLVVEASRPTISGGGASAVEMELDSARTVPSPTLSEVLRGVPLIRVRQNSRGQVQPSIRGMEERQIAVFLDGVPITIGWDNRTDLSVVPLTAANRVEVVRGLSSVLAGPNALGGVVRIGITRGSFPDSLDERFRVRTGVDRTGAFTSSGEVNHLWAREEDGVVWLRYGGGYRDRRGVVRARGLPDGARGEDDDLLRNSDREHANGFLALRYQSGDGGPWASMSTSAFRAERGVVPEFHLLGGPDPAPRFWRIPEHWRTVTSLSGGTGWGQTPWGRGKLEASAGLDFQHLEIDSFESLALRDSVSGETGNDRTLSLRLVGDHTFGPGRLTAAATYAETRHEEILPQSEPTDFRQRLWSFGVETEQPLAEFLPFWDGEGFFSSPELTVGFSGDGAGTPETGERPDRPDIWSWGGRLATEVTVANGAARIHGGVSRKVRFPALRELFSGALGKFDPNPGLGPLRLKVGELGSTVHLGRRLELQGIVFTQRLKGSIVRAVLPDGQFQRQNRGETRATGIELVGSYRSAGFTLQGDLTLQNVRLLDDEGEPTDEEPEYQPEVVAGLNLEAPLPGDVRARGRFEYFGRQFGANQETGRFETLEPTDYYELGLSRRWDGAAGFPPLGVSLTVENLTDEALFDQLGLPRPGRNFQLQARLF